MQIKIINFNDNDNIAFFFKFTEINVKKNNNKFNNNDLYIPNSNKNIIIFYLEKLNYVRTVVVDKKSGLRNLKNEEKEKEKEKIMEDQGVKLDLKTNKKRRKSFQINEEDSESSEKNK